MRNLVFVSVSHLKYLFSWKIDTCQWESYKVKKLGFYLFYYNTLLNNYLLLSKVRDFIYFTCQNESK